MKEPDRRPFRFKQFTMYQDRCAMKIGTDGVMLGGWSRVEDLGNARALDVGTGTGLLSLMIAQRNLGLKIDALEIDADAFAQAKENVANSPFAEQIRVHHTAVQQWSSAEQYSLIVSNPPFYKDVPISPDAKRTMARHEGSLSLPELVASIQRLLCKEGRFSVVWPIERESELVSSLNDQGVYLERRCRVAPRPNKPFHRVLLSFRKTERDIEVEEEVLVIEQFGRGVFTSEFIRLLRAYYLDF